MQRFLVILGIAILVVAIAWPWLAKLPIGRLPGDLHASGRNWSVSVPLMTCLLVSVALTLILWLMRR